MTALAASKALYKLDGSPLPVQIGYKQKISTTIYPGALCAVDTTGYCRPARTSTTDAVVGYAKKNPRAATGLYTSTVAGDTYVEVAAGVIELNNSASSDEITITEIWDYCYVVDDQTVAKTDGTSTRVRAGRVVGLTGAGVLVLVGLAMTAIDSVTLTGAETLTNKVLTTPTIADMTNATHDHADAAGGGATLTSSTLVTPTIASCVNVAAIADYKGTIDIPLATFFDADGDPIVKFVDASAATFGLNLADSKNLNMRWNNDGTPGTMLGEFTVPADADVTKDILLKFMCSKSGATIGDATTIDVEAFNQVNGALHDADSDYGSTSDALTGDATAKTLDVIFVTLAAAGLPAAGSKVTISVTPHAGLLGTDDLLISRIWGEYTKQVA